MYECGFAQQHLGNECLGFDRTVVVKVRRPVGSTGASVPAGEQWPQGFTIGNLALDLPTQSDVLAHLLDRMRRGEIVVRARQFDQFTIVPPQRIDLGFAQVFDVDQPVTGALHRGDDLVEFQVNRQRVLVLRALNQKHHQERDDRRAGIDHELPRVGIMEEWSTDQPDHDHCSR